MSIETFDRVLGEHPFFEGLGEHHLATLVGCASNVVFEDGEFLFREGQPAEQFYVVRHGTVAVSTFAPDRGAITIETVFSIPGLGLLATEALTVPDYWVLQGTFLVASFAVILASLAANLVYGLLDPRVRT